MPTYGCRLQHKAYSCRRNFEWKRKRAFSERFHISCLPSMYNFSGSKYDLFFSILKKGRRWKRIVISHFQAKYVFERRFTAKHLTMFGFFLTYSQSVRAKKKVLQTQNFSQKSPTLSRDWILNFWFFHFSRQNSHFSANFLWNFVRISRQFPEKIE